MPLEAIDSIRLRRKAVNLFGIADEAVNLDDEAFLGQIRTKYRQLAHQHHPDKNPCNPDESAKKMAEIIDAYKMLLTPKTMEEEHMERFYDNYFGFI